VNFGELLFRAVGWIRARERAKASTPRLSPKLGRNPEEKLTASADFHCEDLGGVESERDVDLIDDLLAGGREGRLPALRDKAKGTNGADKHPGA
jgi:hypothetical protein